MNYFNYLRTRSILSLLYRKFFLYPRISRHLQGTILDFGCGIGDFLDFYPNAIGADINSECVSFCRSKGHHVYLIDDGQVNLPSGSIDSIVLDNVIEHVSSPLLILNELDRLLTPHGLLLIGIPGHKGFHSDPDHKCFYSYDSLCSLLEEHSFKPISTTFSPFKSSFLDRRLSLYCIYVVFSRSS